MGKLLIVESSAVDEIFSLVLSAPCVCTYIVQHPDIVPGSVVALIHAAKQHKLFPE